MSGAPPRGPRIVTIPAGVAFVDALALGVLAEHGGDPLALARATILLPTRRACRALRDGFLRARAGAPLLLPRLRPIGDVDEDEFLDGDGLDAGPDLPPAIDPVERHCLLTRLVLARHGGDPALAARLAAALAALIDSLATEEIDFSALAGIVPAEFAAHWQKTLDFLEIVGTAWPAILAERGRMDGSARRVALIRALAQRWQANPPPHPVYAAGSTGSIPASATLIGVVARLPQGCVVLPGLDQTIDDDAWALAGEDATHPQYGLAHLLAAIGVARADVPTWPAGVAAPASPRARLLGQAMLPAARTETWTRPGPEVAPAIAGLTRIEAAGPQDEALAIALALRQALDTAGRTAALVTPDRGLARRVAAELRRWDVAIDDSAGQRLARTPPAVFLLLAARMVAEAFAPLALLAALKHPLCAAAGDGRGAWLEKLRRLERRVLRGPAPPPGFAGLRALTAEKSSDLLDWLDALGAACAPFAALPDPAPAAALLDAHVTFAETLSGGDGAPALWEGDDGNALAAFVAALRESSAALGDVSPRAWPDLVEALMEGVTVRPRWGSHPRVAILGPLEARLLHADLVVLGGLNEGVWPPEPQEDPWLSRPMRKAVGLPAPERRIGLSAHDFAQAASGATVLLTRARKVEGAPAVPSRWWLRLDAMLHGNDAWRATLDSGLVALANALDAPTGPATPPSPPMPRPPVAARPRRLSVTQIETWIRDPYAIYARHVLKLKKLPPLDEDDAAIERGNVFHAILDRLVREHPDTLPDDAVARLIAWGRSDLARLLERPAWKAFWWPRFEAAARWFVAWENERRAAGFRALVTEAKGELPFAGRDGPFVLRARTDRIDRGPDGLWILDYKTGRAPSPKEVGSGLAPQLSLEAAIAAAGGFSGVPSLPLAGLAYVELRGGDPPGELKEIHPKRDGTALDAAALAAEARAGLARRILQFDDPNTPYLSRPRPQWLEHEGDYDHLARVREWQAGSEA